MIDRPKLYRDALDKSRWRWTPRQIATMPVPQMLLIFRQADLFFSSPAAVLGRVNEARGKRGLPPIKSKRTG